MIDNIRVVDIDTESEHSPRTLRIKTEKRTIETPCRMMTSTENKFKKDLALSPLDEKSNIEMPLFELVKTPRFKTVRDLRIVNGTLNKMKRSINNGIRGFEESITFLNLRFSRNEEPLPEDIESLIHLQCRTKLDLVSIPDLSRLSKKEEFESYIRNHRKYVENVSKKEVTPIIDMNNREQVLKIKIETAIENNFKIIVLRCRSFDYYYPNYRFIKDTKKEEEVWFHMVDTFRDFPTTSLNYTNIPQVFGVDTVAPRTPYGGGETKKKLPEDTKRFDRISFDNVSLKIQKEKYEDLLKCDCPICQEKTVSEYIDEYKVCKNQKEKNPIYKWSRLHEIFATSSEFEIGRKFIRSQEFDNYIKSKTSARDFLSNLTRRSKEDILS